MDAGFSVEVAGHRVGIVTNEGEATALLRAALAPIVVDGPPTAVAPGIRLLLGADRGRVTGLHFLYRGTTLVLQTPSRSRAVRAALVLPEAWLDPPPGTVPCNANLLVSGTRAIAVTGPFADVVFAAAPRLAKRGWALATPSLLSVDVTAGEVVIAPRRLTPDRAGLQALDHTYSRGTAEPRAAPGRYRLSAVVDLGPGTDTAAGVGEGWPPTLGSLVTGLPRPLDEADADALATLERTHPFRRIEAWDTTELLRFLGDHHSPGSPDRRK